MGIFWHKFESHAQPLPMINGVPLVQAHRDPAVPEGTTVGESNGQTVEMLSQSFLFSEGRHDEHPNY